MAKKKRSSPKRPKPPARSKSEPPEGWEAGSPAPLGDRRALEGLMWGIMGPIEETPLSLAQDLVYEAFDERDPDERVRLAEEALAVSPDCADAYVLLAEQAETRKSVLAMYEQAVAAGERALGPAAFRDDVGDFWGLLETRPYMRAREALAHALWLAGRRGEAVEHLRDMLRLNPNDNQGVRYTLASWLMVLDRDDDLAGLLDRYDEDSATWAYSRTLLAFRRIGDGADAVKLLKAARKINKHVPAYLVGDEPLPPHPPEYYSPGQESEAVVYAAEALPAWRSTPGALTWLAEVVRTKRRGKRKDVAPSPAGPTSAAKDHLKKLPRSPDVWQVGGGPLPGLVDHEGRLVQPWLILVADPDPDHGPIAAQAISMDPPTAEGVWDALARAMSDPLKGEPRRPTRVQVRPGPIGDELRTHLAEIGVDCVEADELDLADFLLDDLSKHLASQAEPGLLDAPGVTPERAAAFHRAAAEFYRRAPWQSLGFEQAIRIDSDRHEGGPWYAVVMGRSGLAVGLTLYEDLDLLQQTYRGELTDEENALRAVALTVTFEPERDVPTADLLAIREHGWEVAGPEAYPSAFKKEEDMNTRPPLPWELDLLEECLRAIPAFVAEHPPDAASTRRKKAPRGSKKGKGKPPLTLTWLEAC